LIKMTQIRIYKGFGTSVIVVVTFINSDNLYMTLCLRPAINLQLTILISVSDCCRLVEPVGTRPQDFEPGIIPILIVNY
jgi:hypothetical protein